MQKNELELLKDVVTCIYEKNIQKENKVFNAARYISHTKTDIYKLEISTQSFIVSIITYLEKYPLQGQKHIIFSRWKRIYLNKDMLKQQSLFSSRKLERFKKLVGAVQNNKKT